MDTIKFLIKSMFELSVKNIIEAEKDTRLIRSLDTVFLKNLKEKMANDPSSGVPPIAALCVDVK